MTKPDLFAAPGCRHHVADLHLAIGDDHPIDQEFHQSPFLLECGTRQSLPHSFAERPGGVGQHRQLVLPICLGFELPRLLLQFLPAPLELTAPALILGQRHDTSEIGLGQTLELLLQAHLTPSQPLLASLQLLWQPVSAPRPRQRLGDLLRMAQQRTQVRPDQLIQPLSRAQARRALLLSV